jgi:hypothetical protein
MVFKPYLSWKFSQLVMLWFRSHKEFPVPAESHAFSPISSILDVGAFIAARGREPKPSQQDLSPVTGVNQANLSRIERGLTSAELDTYVKLLSPLGIDLFAKVRS